ncbi:MAG TPA: accessory Sec system translocase SecA2 [Clostridia bacterium]
MFKNNNRADKKLEKYNEILKKVRMINLRNHNTDELRKLSEELIHKARNGQPLDNLLIEAYALVNEAIIRILKLKAFDVQIMAGIALHEGKLIEMQTGEGKTLVSVFPAYLNAITGLGVHILTFNDYLARRDAEWMGPVFNFLGLTAGFINEDMSREERKKAYSCDITYVTAKEAGFDYLRDSLSYEISEIVHRPFDYTIIDEADSIMIDEARIPLILASNRQEDETVPTKIVNIIKRLKPEDHYCTDDSSRNVYLTDNGIKYIEEALACGNLYEEKNFELLANIQNELHAEVLLKRDVDYIVKDGRIELIDEFTGRVAKNRHWPDELQAAVEAKEGLTSDMKGQILNQITIQSFINLYPKICGMTGTAVSARDEFMEFYGLETVVIPPNRPCIRIDLPDMVFSNKKAKYEALLNEIKFVNSTGRPILIGTGSISESSSIASILKESAIHCQVLNAKNDEYEAKIIANAGNLGAVTVSTNMAGRGTDIKLGGDDEKNREQVTALGGLYVIGTTRHESVRIDNQLRGRAGRQGDPGSSRFFISLQDDILKKYSIERIVNKKHIHGNTSTRLENIKILNGILKVQKIIEGQNFDIRKTLWRYSNLIEAQRNYIFKRREDVLTGKSKKCFLKSNVPDLYANIEDKIGADALEDLEKNLTLYCIDKCWAQYLEHISYIRDGIHLTIIGGQNPFEAYISEVDRAFKELLLKIDESIITTFKSIKIESEGIDIGIDDLKGPSSTWTYMINDNPFADDLGLMLGNTRNIGASVAAAFFPWMAVITIVSLIYQRFLKRGKIIE